MHLETQFLFAGWETKLTSRSRYNYFSGFFHMSCFFSYKELKNPTLLALAVSSCCQLWSKCFPFTSLMLVRCSGCQMLSAADQIAALSSLRWPPVISATWMSQFGYGFGKCLRSYGHTGVLQCDCQLTKSDELDHLNDCFPPEWLLSSTVVLGHAWLQQKVVRRNHSAVHGSDSCGYCRVLAMLLSWASLTASALLSTLPIPNFLDISSMWPSTEAGRARWSRFLQ